MWKKIALNVFYNLGIIVSGIGVYWCFTSSKQWLIGLFILTGALFVYLKIHLLKEVRQTNKK